MWGDSVRRGFGGERRRVSTPRQWKGGERPRKGSEKAVEGSEMQGKEAAAQQGKAGKADLQGQSSSSTTRSNSGRSDAISAGLMSVNGPQKPNSSKCSISAGLRSGETGSSAFRGISRAAALARVRRAPTPACGSSFPSSSWPPWAWHWPAAAGGCHLRPRCSVPSSGVLTRRRSAATSRSVRHKEGR